MNNPQFLDELTSRLGAAISSSPAKDIEKNIRALLAQGFARLDLVTREEFDVQAELLSRARKKQEELESKVAELERRGK